MKISKFAFRLFSLAMTFVLIFGVSGLSALAADESDYVAEFSIETDKTSVEKNEDVIVSVNLKTNYYIYAMQVPVIYDGDVFEVQNTSPTSLNSFLTFEGKLASTYRTNGNWKSPASYYTSRNSNTDYWSQKAVMDKYKVAFASWAVDTTLNDGKAVKLADEETIFSFVLRAKEDVDNIEELIFLSNDFLKTSDFSGGLWFCGRSKTEQIDIYNYAAVGQTIIYNGIDPTKKEPEVSAFISPADGTNTIIDKEKGLIYGLDEGIYSLDGYVKVEGYTLSYTYFKDSFGTGTRVDCLLNGEIQETYYIVVFGDLSGDAVIDTYDTAILAAISNFDIEVEKGSLIALAADIVNNDGVADTYDLAKLYAAVNGDCVISQTENYFTA